MIKGCGLRCVSLLFPAASDLKVLSAVKNLARSLAKSYHEMLRFTQHDTKGDDSADGVLSSLLSKAKKTPTLLHSNINPTH